MHGCMCQCLIVLLLFISAALLESTGNGKGCYYKGTFHYGNWTDGCEFNCTCLDSEIGHYKCHIRCPVYLQIPEGCVLKPPSGEECCKKLDCSATNSNSNKNKNDNSSSSNSNGDNDEASEINTNLNGPLNDSSTDNEEDKGCFYKGKYYNGNWTDGCDFNCSCEDPVLGIYQCKKRCREYTELDPGCILKLPSAEHCCKVPVCNSAETLTNTDNNAAEMKTSINTIILTTLPPILTDFLEATSIQPVTENDSKGVPYKTISDTKISQNISKEISTEQLRIIFSRFGPIRLFTLRKNVNKNNATPNGKETTTSGSVEIDQQNVVQEITNEFKSRNNELQNKSTDNESIPQERSSVEIGGVCSYKEMNFTEGEQWYDGCDVICVCENATKGIYKCRSRCKTYNALPVGCVLRRSKADSCCLVPDCRFATIGKDTQQRQSYGVPPRKESPEAAQISLVKRMFNRRIQMRNKLPQTEKYKMPSMEGQRDVNLLESNRLDRTEDSIANNIERISRNTDKTFPNLLKQIYLNGARDRKLYENFRPKTGARTPVINSHRQKIVQPERLIQSDLTSNHESSATDSEKAKSENKENSSDSYRMIATETGIFKVRKKDGVILPNGKLMTSVLKRKVDEAVSRNDISSGFCTYKDKRFYEGETWLDGCKLACICKNNGQYSCQKRCPEYSRIPSGCSLVMPRAGQCCALLLCRRTPPRYHPRAAT